MTKRIVNVAVLVAVVGMVVLGPSTAFAAPRGPQMTNIETRSAGLFEMFLRLIGFNPVSAASKSSPVQTAPTSTGSLSRQGNTGVSLDEAIWGGGNRCRLGC